jgi:hypothetical protein
MQQLVAIGNHIRPGHRPELLGLNNSDKRHEIPDIDLVDPSGAGAGNIGEPFGLGGNIGQLSILRRCQ